MRFKVASAIKPTEQTIEWRTIAAHDGVEVCEGNQILWQARFPGQEWTTLVWMDANGNAWRPHRVTSSKLPFRYENDGKLEIH